jgi:hypothetical protein
MRTTWMCLVAAVTVYACHDNRTADNPSTTSGTFDKSPPASQPAYRLDNSRTNTQLIDPALNRPPTGARAAYDDSNNANSGLGANLVSPGAPANSAGAATGSNTLDTKDTDARQTDHQIMQGVRSALNDIPALSSPAKNMYIGVVGGHVTLRGEVKSERERAQVINAAKKLAGDANVEDQLTLAK